MKRSAPYILIGLFSLFLGMASAHAEGQTWSKQQYDIKGTWTIVEEDGQKYVVLSDDFKTRNAPDLKIFLSPTAASDLTDNNATEGSVLVSQLDSNKGEQKYAIPADVDLAGFSSIVIYCEKFSKLWGASDL